MTSNTVALIDPDPMRRDQISREIGDMQFQVSSFEDARAYAQSGTAAAIVLCADAGRAVSALISYRSVCADHFYLMAFREKPDVRDIVTTMQIGAEDYLEWPFQGRSLEYRLRNASDRNVTAPVIPLDPSQAQAGIDLLSDREMQVMRLISDGYSTRTAAQMLGISRRTVEIHRSNILLKTRTKNAAQLIKLFVEAGLGAEARLKKASS